MKITIDCRDERPMFHGGKVVTVEDGYGMETSFNDAIQLLLDGLTAAGYSPELAKSWASGEYCKHCSCESCKAVTFSRSLLREEEDGG